MLKLTLDTNCLINIEGGTGQAQSISKLINLHRQNEILVFLSGSSAGENQAGKTALGNYVEFQQRLARIDVPDLPVIPPLARYGVSFFWDVSVLGGDSDVELEQQIRSILSSDSNSYGDHLAEQGLPIDTPIDTKWRNLYSDMDVMLLHIRSGHDILVTEDRHFLSPARRERFAELGARTIATPDDSLALVIRHLSP